MNASSTIQTDLNAMTQRLGESVASDMQPLIDAIVTSLREGQQKLKQDVSVTIAAPEGQALLVSLRTEVRYLARPGVLATRGLDASQLQRIKGAIHEKIGESLSVAMLSEIAGLSRSHFSLAFRASVGWSPHVYIVRQRIERAMDLMRDTTASLTEIAIASGFSDQSHFTKLFRRATGTTPTEWRRHQSSHLPPSLPVIPSGVEGPPQSRQPRQLNRAATTTKPQDSH